MTFFTRFSSRSGRSLNAEQRKAVEVADSLRNEIGLIGSRMVKCKENCRGISCDLNNGRIPRCLYLDGDAGSFGFIVVGLNPGKAKDKEEEAYKNALKEGKDRYFVFTEYFRKHVLPSKYYKNIREMLEIIQKRLHDKPLRLTKMPILWTELVKCQSVKNGSLNDNTLRMCLNKYLKEEIRLVPGEWIIIANGRKTYDVCVVVFENRVVIGIPHCTSSRGHFKKLVEKLKNSKSTTNKQLEELLKSHKSKHGLAGWLGAKPK